MNKQGDLMQSSRKQSRESEQQKNSTSSMPLVALAIAIGCLAFSAGFVGAASGEDGPPASMQNVAPTAADFQEAHDTSAARSIEMQLSDPDAAEDLPHHALGREEALDLLRSVFPLQLQAPAGIFDELEVEKFLSDSAAIVAPAERPDPAGIVVGDGTAMPQYNGPTMIESTLPLRSEDSSGRDTVVDLAIEHSEGELQSANPLVEVGIPANLGEGISFPSVGVQMELQGAPQGRSPSTAEESVAFYPNVEQDTDFVVAPTPTGLETFAHLRSPEAPRSQTFQLGLPDGAELQRTELGGAQVQSTSGRVLLTVQPPSAIDASGEEVPVSLRVTDDSIKLIADPPPSADYPILVDPIIELYSWQPPHWTFRAGDWQPTTTTSVLTPYVLSGKFGLWGLDVQAEPGALMKPGNVGQWNYYVPRWNSDWNQYGTRPTSFIASMALSSVGFWTNGDKNTLPGMAAGIWDDVGQKWSSVYVRLGNEGDLANLASSYLYPGNNNHNNHTAVGTALFYSSPTERFMLDGRLAFVGAAAIEVADTEVPKFGSVSGPPGWIDGTFSAPLSYSVTDSGIGMWAWYLTAPNGTPLGSEGFGCGPAENPCARTWSSADSAPQRFTYDVSKLPQGISNLSLKVADVIGNVSQPAIAQVKIDRAAPQLTVSGSLTQSGSYEPINTPTLTVGAQAKDGSTAEPQSGVASLELKVDGNLFDSASCSTQNCEIQRNWTLDLTKYSAGPHTVLLRATDRVGRVTIHEIPFSTFHDSTAPQISNPTDPSSMSLVNGPEGWLSDGTYGLTQKVFDNYLGVKKAQFFVDGIPAGSPASCQGTASGCSVQPTLTLSTEELSGGAHTVALNTEDPRGNKVSKTWTIRINPSGEISPEEAEKTLEAFEDTAERPEVPSLSPVAPTDEVLEEAIIAAGVDPGFQEREEMLESTGVPATSTITPSTGTIAIEGSLGTVEITPAAEQPAELEIVNGVAAVSSSVASGVNTTVRPEFNGIFAFAAIREASSPEKFIWHVNVPPEQELRQVDADHAEMVYGDGTVALTISAEPAHDATGTAVPTHLEVSEDSELVLTVAHGSSSYAYPVVAGQAFEVTYDVVTIIEPGIQEEESENPGTPLRDPFPPSIGESLTSGEVRRLLAKPRLKGAGGATPVATASKTRLFEVDEHICHPDTCHAYEISMHGARFWRYTNSVEWVNGTTITCSGDIDLPFTLSTEIDIANSGFVGPWKVGKGSGSHLTVWCHYELNVWIADDPGIPGVPKPWSTRSMQVWIYPNGYQEWHTYKWDPKSWIFEN